MATLQSLTEHNAAGLRPNYDALLRLRTRPLAFVAHFVRRHPAGHAIVLSAVVLAIVCGVGAQYGMKHLIDVITGGPAAAGTRVWWAFAFLAGMAASDNLLWRVAGYAAARTFVAIGATSTCVFREMRKCARYAPEK